MNPAARGAVLVVIAALLGFLVLRGAADVTQTPIAVGATLADPTPTSLEVSPDDTVAVTTPTVVIDPSQARPNNEVNVLVANGTEVSGQASRLTTALRNKGFLTAEPRNADAQATSTIFYRPGFGAEATIVRSVLGGSTPIAPMPDPDPIIGEGIDIVPIDVLVLVGADDLATS